jgi:hypothetical protein
VLRKGGAARKYELDDAVHFIEDLETLENWFIAKDEAASCAVSRWRKSRTPR